MDINIVMRVSGGESLTALARRFERAAAGGLQRKLARSVQQQARPALARTRAAWMGVEVESSKGGGSTSGLRARVAAATSALPTATGVAVEVDGAAVDSRYGRGLAWYLDGYGRWRHPTYGRSPWQQQTGQEVFFRTLRGHEPVWRAGLERVVDEVAREIEGGL